MRRASTAWATISDGVLTAVLPLIRLDALRPVAPSPAGAHARLDAGGKRAQKAGHLSVVPHAPVVAVVEVGGLKGDRLGVELGQRVVRSAAEGPRDLRVPPPAADSRSRAHVRGQLVVGALVQEGRPGRGDWARCKEGELTGGSTRRGWRPSRGGSRASQSSSRTAAASRTRRRGAP
jgi:hypothetical protein